MLLSAVQVILYAPMDDGEVALEMECPSRHMLGEAGPSRTPQLDMSSDSSKSGGSSSSSSSSDDDDNIHKCAADESEGKDPEWV